MSLLAFAEGALPESGLTRYPESVKVFVRTLPDFVLSVCFEQV